jgi:hypothetical protein
MPQTVVNGLNVYHRDEGDSIPVVLGRSSTGSSGQWRQLMKRLSGLSPRRSRPRRLRSHASVLGLRSADGTGDRDCRSALASDL